MKVNDASTAAEAAARASYGRLVAYLAARSHDLTAAEDALADAFRSAIETWARDGVPIKPEAWLLTAAYRKIVDAKRHDRVLLAASGTLQLLADESRTKDEMLETFPDERLKLLFVCAHPAVDRAARTSLMLQTVLGLDVARIAAAFLVAPATVAQRLVRAKAKIRDAGIAFEVPGLRDLAPRLDAVLDAIYAAFGAGWEDVAGADPRLRNLVPEAIWLARLVAELLPDEPEAKGLLALMLHCEARRSARRTEGGAFVPLSEQDTSLWQRSLMVEAERLLMAASAARRIGRFQLEAAIQSAHAERARGGKVDWVEIVRLYDGLVALAPGIGALVGRAAAIAELRGAEYGLAALELVPPEVVATYQPYWALQGHLLSKLGRVTETRNAYELAVGLSEDEAVREFLMERCRSATAR